MYSLNEFSKDGDKCEDDESIYDGSSKNNEDEITYKKKMKEMEKGHSPNLIRKWHVGKSNLKLTRSFQT